jgi:hypothetical protein
MKLLAHSNIELGENSMQIKENLGLHGKVEVFVSKGKPEIKRGPELAPNIFKWAEIDFSKCKFLDKQEIHNIILNQGKDTVIQSLTTGFIKVIARIAIGDRGALPSDQTVPKTPVSTMTELYNEVYRADIDTTTLTIGDDVHHEVKFIRTFSALDIPISSFSNQANPIINEVALIMADLLSGDPLPRSPVASPDDPPADEKLFSIRTFKSVPFEAANEISITIRYTIFIE